VTSTLTSSSDKEDRVAENDEADPSRRDFLKVAMTLSAIMAFGGVGTVLKAVSNPAPPGVSSLNFPRVKVADTSISVNSPVYFNYPLDSESNFLVKLGQKAAGGVGPDQDIVAFSQICQHAGCYVAYQAQGPPGYPYPVGNCPCHGSIFNLLESAKVVAIPSPRPLPQVQLDVDSSGNIFAKGMGPPTIFGHNTGSNDVSSDLQGGNLVG
jgi:arsenite oxidase small subunit